MECLPVNCDTDVLNAVAVIAKCNSKRQGSVTYFVPHCARSTRYDSIMTDILNCKRHILFTFYFVDLLTFVSLHRPAAVIISGCTL